MTIRDQIETLDDLTTPELAARYEDLHGRRPRCRHRQWLTKRVAFKLQEIRYGGLSVTARKRLEELMAQVDPSILDEPAKPQKAPQALAAGSSLTKLWHGQRHVVHVLADGQFEWDGQRFRSLTAVAKAITGMHVSGPAFFGVRKARVS